MRQDLKLAEREEATGALDRVNRAEDALEQRVGVGFLLKRDQVTIELIEVLVALHEELAHDLVELVHETPRDSSPAGPGTRRGLTN